MLSISPPIGMTLIQYQDLGISESKIKPVMAYKLHGLAKGSAVVGVCLSCRWNKYFQKSKLLFPARLLVTSWLI